MFLKITGLNNLKNGRAGDRTGPLPHHHHWGCEHHGSRGGAAVLRQWPTRSPGQVELLVSRRLSATSHECSPPRVCGGVGRGRMGTAGPLAFQGQLCPGRGSGRRGSWLMAGLLLVSVLPPSPPRPAQISPWLRSSLLVCVCFHFPVSLRLPASASSGSLLRMSLSSSPCLGLLFFLFRASSQTLLLLPNAAAAVSESLRLGTADRNSGQFLGCWNSAGWKVVSF